MNYRPNNFEIGLAWRANTTAIYYQTDELSPTGRKTRGVWLTNLREWVQETAKRSDDIPYDPYDPTKHALVKLSEGKESWPIDCPPEDWIKDRPMAKDVLVTGPIANALSIPADISAILSHDPFSIIPPTENQEHQVLQEVLDLTGDNFFLRTAIGIVSRTWNTKQVTKAKEPNNYYGNNIGVVMVSPDGERILAWGVNMKSRNACFHAETLMLLNYLACDGKSIEDGTRFYTTLEPCHMCSGLVTTICPNAKVYTFTSDNPECTQTSLRPRGGERRSQISLSPHLESRVQSTRERSNTLENVINYLFTEDAKALHDSQEVKSIDGGKDAMSFLASRFCEYVKSRKLISETR